MTLLRSELDALSASTVADTGSAGIDHGAWSHLVGSAGRLARQRLLHARTAVDWHVDHARPHSYADAAASSIILPNTGIPVASNMPGRRVGSYAQGSVITPEDVE